MIFAVVNGKKQRASKGQLGICPLCGEVVIPKCGNYKIHHWSHKKGSDCDSWSEGETEWHLSWKSFFDEKNQEVVVIDSQTNERHRADIKTDNNMVIELQNSPISDETIEIRTKFYGKMFWIVNGTTYGYARHDFLPELKKKKRDSNCIEFTYHGYSKLFEKWTRVSVPVFIDFQTNDLYWLKSYDKGTKMGIVQVVEKKVLIEKNGGSIPQVEEVPKPSSTKRKNQNGQLSYIQMLQISYRRNRTRL